MKGLVESVRGRIDPECLVPRMRKQGCTVSLKDAPKERLIVDFDKPKAPVRGDGRKCDYLFIADGAQDEAGWVVPLELKKGALRASDAVEQLRAGAEAAERLIPGELLLAFRPVAACGNIHKLERATLRKKQNRIAFRGRMEAVRLMTCGGELMRVLRS